jgi:hypothetical protein
LRAILPLNTLPGLLATRTVASLPGAMPEA